MPLTEFNEVTRSFYRNYTLFLKEEAREGYTKAMTDPAAPGVNPEYVCQLKIDFYQHILAMNPAESAAYTRRYFSPVSITDTTQES